MVKKKKKGEKIMCWKDPSKIFKPVKLRALSFTINDYPGSINDLNGCNNDGKQCKDVFLNYWPEFDIRRYVDSEATIENHRYAVIQSIKTLSPGATVIVFADSCFSGTITRPMELGLLDNPHPTRNRFYPQPGVPIRPVIKVFVSRGNIYWIVFSGCGETQFSSDAWINSAYHGAFSWYGFNVLKPGLTYREWYQEIRTYLPSKNFDQIPALEGPDYLIDRKVFEDQTLFIHNSTHGTQLNGIAEEPIDEAICFYNGNLRDNDYYKMLINISKAKVV